MMAHAVACNFKGFSLPARSRPVGKFRKHWYFMGSGLGVVSSHTITCSLICCRLSCLTATTATVTLSHNVPALSTSVPQCWGKEKNTKTLHRFEIKENRSSQLPHHFTIYTHLAVFNTPVILPVKIKSNILIFSLLLFLLFCFCLPPAPMTQLLIPWHPFYLTGVNYSSACLQVSANTLYLVKKEGEN